MGSFPRSTRRLGDDDHLYEPGRTDAHRPAPQDLALEDIFAWKEERTVTHNLTLQYDKIMFLLEPNEITRPLARQRVTVIDYPDGRLAIRHKGGDLPYRTYDKLQRVTQAAIVENKRLSEILAYVAQASAGAGRATVREGAAAAGAG